MSEVKATSADAEAIIKYTKDHKLAEIRAKLREFSKPEIVLNSFGSAGHTPLWRAVKEGDLEIVKVMLSHGADPMIHALHQGKGNCLHVAAEYAHPELVALLINKVAVESRTEDRDETPLWLACKSGSLASAKLLIEAGADIFAQNIDGVDCYGIARASTYLPILALLREHGYDPGDIVEEEEVEREPQIGDVVTHPTFGDGEILSIYGSEDMLKFQVEFKEFGQKLMLAKFITVIGPSEEEDYSAR